MTGGDRPRAFIEMELLQGSNGRQLLVLKERIEVANALDILIDICHALDAAHRADLVHQDLKPDNIFIHTNEWTGRAVTKLLDFGIARILGQAHLGSFEGTLAYAAPEQLRGEPVTPKADLYALGVIAFELITGQRPFDAAEADDERKDEVLGSWAASAEPQDLGRHLWNAILTQAPPRPCDYVRLPRDLENLILQLLEKDPAKRPESAKAVANALTVIKQNPLLPKSTMTTQEVLLKAAHAPKVPVMKGQTFRIEVADVAAAARAMGRELGAEGALIPGSPRDGTTMPDAPLLVPSAALPAMGRGASVASHVPNRDPRAMPFTTMRLTQAQTVREATSLPNAGPPPADEVIGTFEPLVGKSQTTQPEGSEDEEREALPVRPLARRIAMACVGARRGCRDGGWCRRRATDLAVVCKRDLADTADGDACVGAASTRAVPSDFSGGRPRLDADAGSLSHAASTSVAPSHSVAVAPTSLLRSRVVAAGAARATHARAVLNLPPSGLPLEDFGPDDNAAPSKPATPVRHPSATKPAPSASAHDPLLDWMERDNKPAPTH